MDENEDLGNELQRLQSSIASLFSRVVNERDKYKDEKEKSLASINTLHSEITYLKQENECLRKNNDELKKSCKDCLLMKERLLNQDAKFKKLEKNIGLLRKLVNHMSPMSSFQLSEVVLKHLDDLKQDISSQIDGIIASSGGKNITSSEIELLAYNTFQNSSESPKFSFKGTSTSTEENNQEEKNNISKDVRNMNQSYLEIPLMDKESKMAIDQIYTIYHTPKKQENPATESNFSPLDSSFSIKKEGESPVLVEQRRPLKNNLFSSPNQFKRKALELASPQKKRVEKKSLFKSPSTKVNISPAKVSRLKKVSQLKASNKIEVEISQAGFRKLKQAQLNLDYYKSKSHETDESTSYDVLNLKIGHVESKFGEEDLILGTPENSGKMFDFKKNFWHGDEENKGCRSKSVTSPVFDPEETFVSSSILREKHVDEEPNVKKETSPEAPSRSPEYNTVPYAYKGSPVRKKSERMKLPGHMCMECRKYYEAALGDIDPEKLQEILDQCSRHREKHCNVIDTPPGYWKPYLTPTQDEDTCLRQ